MTKKVWWYRYQTNFGSCYWSRVRPNKCQDIFIGSEKSETEPKDLKHA